MLGVDAIRAFSKWKEDSNSHGINNTMLLIGMSANVSTEDQNEAFEEDLSTPLCCHSYLIARNLCQESFFFVK